MMEAIKEQTGIKEVDLNTVNFDKRVIKMIQQNLCNKYTLIPFGFHEGKLQVAMHDFEELRKAADKYTNQGICMGEGWMITAEMAVLVEHGIKNKIGRASCRERV